MSTRGKCGDCRWKSYSTIDDVYYCIGSPEHFSEDPSLIPKERVKALNPEMPHDTITLVNDDDDCFDKKIYGWGFSHQETA